MTLSNQFSIKPSINPINRILITDIKEPSSLKTRVAQVVAVGILTGLAGLLIAHFGAGCPWVSLNTIGLGALTGAGLGGFLSSLIVQNVNEHQKKEKMKALEAYQKQGLDYVALQTEKRQIRLLEVLNEDQ